MVGGVEEERLLPGTPADVHHQQRSENKAKRVRAGAMAAIGLTIGAAFIAVATSSAGSSATVSSGALDQEEAVDPLSIAFSNEYTARGDKQPGVDYPWMENLMEPWRDTTLSVDVDVIPGQGFHFVWDVDGTNSTGMSVVQRCTTPNKYTHIKVFEYTREGELVNSGSTKAMCKYVRRELRTLTETDRELFFDTLETAYGLSTEIGRAAYGPMYKAAEDFTLIHNTMSGHMDCDHLHGGLGFLPQHAAMTLSFERSLQTVNPQITMPYWDYTIEGHAMNMANESLDAWYLSPIWEDNWFGEYSPNGFAISRGRFAFQPVRRDAWTVSSVTNSYGLLRSPWNNNKIPFVTRHHKSYGFLTKTSIVPTCYNHYDQMNMDFFEQFGSSIQYAPHGSLHILAGGTFGADYHFYLGDHYQYHEKRAQPLGTVTMARIWRKQWMTCPDYCTSDTDVKDCKCKCDQLESWIANNLTNVMLENMYPGIANAKHVLLDDHGHDISEFFLRMLCNDDESLTPQIGDFMESASPGDPIFWPTHPTLDRLWVWRKINGFTSETWVNSSCWGHNEDDTTTWHIGSDDQVETQYTNGELMELFNPELDTVPYIYDTFTWPHCEAEGYPLQLVEQKGPPDGAIPGDAPPMQFSTAPSEDDYVWLNWGVDMAESIRDINDPPPVPMRL